MDSFRKATTFDAIATGGADTGSDAMALPIRVGGVLNASNLTRTVTIPPNCYVSQVHVVPLATVSADGTTAPTAGTVDIGVTGTLQKYAAATALTAVSTAAAATAAVTTANESVIFTAAALDGDCYVALEIMPLVRED